MQYYEEIVKYSSIQSTDDGADEGEGEGNNETEQQSANVDESEGQENNNSVCHRPPPSLAPHEVKLLQIVVLWLVILSTTSLMQLSIEDMKFVIGVCVNLNLIFFYAAPLSTILTVVRTKSSSSIHFWTMVMNTSNAFFWCVYSFGIQDYYILIPNGLGFVFGLIQTLLYISYPRDETTGEDDNEQFLRQDGDSAAGGSETEII